MSKTSVGLSEPAYKHLLHLIMTKQLMPGDRIPEVKIAQEFNISRTPVRDAMRQLCNEGLIDIFPNRFAQVRIYTDDMIAEIGTLRVALDSMAIKLACLYGSRADFLKLVDIAEQCAGALEHEDSALRRQLDCDFHLELARIAGNELLSKFQKELYLRVQFIMLHHPDTVVDDLQHTRQHYEIAEALMNHDEKKATDLIVTHLTSFYNLKTRYPENFFALSL